MNRTWVLVLAAVTLTGCEKTPKRSSIGDAKPAAVASEKTAEISSMKAELQRLVSAERSPGDLKVTYDDLHGLHGGLTLSIDGSGKVTQKAVRVKTTEPVDLEPKQVTELLKLLIELEAWHQIVPEAAMVPDESRAHVTIEAGGQTSDVWERFNNLEKHARLVRIRERMKDLAWRR